MTTVPNSPSQLPAGTTASQADLVGLDQPDGLGGYNSKGIPMAALAALIAPLLAAAMVNAISPTVFAQLYNAWLISLPVFPGTPGSGTYWNNAGIPERS